MGSRSAFRLTTSSCHCGNRNRSKGEWQWGFGFGGFNVVLYLCLHWWGWCRCQCDCQYSNVFASNWGAAVVGNGSLDFAASACAFFCSWILAQILTIASTLWPCFFHFKRPWKPRHVRLSERVVKWGDTEEVGNATQQPIECDWDCWKGFMCKVALNMRDWQNRWWEMRPPWIESHRRSLPLWEGELRTSGILDSVCEGTSCQTSSCHSSASLYCFLVIYVT